MEQKFVIHEQVFPESLIPDSILKVKLTSEQKHTLIYGEEIFLNNMELKDGSIKDGKVKIVKDNNTGELTFGFNFKRERLEIPKRLLDNELSEDDKKDLVDGKVVGPLNYKGSNFFVQMDHELNKVTISHSSQFNLQNELGGYRFTDKEQNLLLNGQKTTAHIFKGESGYFMANVQLSPDKRSIIFSNTKSLSNEEALNLLEKFNKQDLYFVPDVTLPIGEMNVNIHKNITPVSNELGEAVYKRDYNRINELVSSGSSASADQLDSIKVSNAFTQEEKLVLLTCLKVENPAEFLNSNNSLNSKSPIKLNHSGIDKQNTISI